MADIVLMRGHKINKKRVVTTKRVSKWSEWLTSCKMAWSQMHYISIQPELYKSHINHVTFKMDCPIKKIPPWAGVPSAWSPALIGGDFTNTAHCACYSLPLPTPIYTISCHTPVTLLSPPSLPL